MIDLPKRLGRWGLSLLSHIRHLFVVAMLVAITPIAMADSQSNKSSGQSTSGQSTGGLTVFLAPPAEVLPSNTDILLPKPQVCPLFVSPEDPALCLARISPPLLADIPDTDFLAVQLDDYCLVDFDTLYAGLTPSPPNRSAFAQAQFIDPLAISLIGMSENKGTPPSALRAAYDIPQFLEGLNVTSSGAIHRDTLAGDLANNSANGRIGVSYREYGINVNIAPDVLVSWGDIGGSETRYGVTNQVSTNITPSLILVASSGYDYFSYDDPLLNRSVMTNRMGLTYKYASGYRLGLSFRNQNAYDEYDSRYIFGPGISVTMPVTDTVSVTATNQFDFTQLNQSDTGGEIPQYGHHQQIEFQASWTPKTIANRGMSVTAGYAYTYDTLTIDSAEPHEASARVALAMRF